MQTERDYAISLGLAKPARGRMSREAHAAIADAKAKGMTFADTTQTRVLATAVNANPLPSSEPVADGINALTPTPPTLRNGYLRFVKKNGGSLSVHVNEACEHCKDSLCFCHCDNPSFRYWKTDDIYTLAS